MAARDVVWALDQLGDDSRRAAFAAGAFDAIGAAESTGLDAHERQLVQRAAHDYGGPGDELGWVGYAQAVRYVEEAQLEVWEDDSAPAHVVRVTDLAEVAGAPSFAAYAHDCLYDPDHGYYAAGAVHFGYEGHFWTYPQRLSPLFGCMVAETLRTILDEWDAAGQLGADDRLRVVELGAGEAHLALDLLDYVHGPEAETWRPYRDRLHYIVGDASAAMRARQAARLAPHVAAGRARVTAIDATAMSWRDPLRGFVVANELLDALAHERLRVGADGEVVRVHVDREDSETRELEVPVRLGWLDGHGRPGPPPPEAQRYLERVVPMARRVWAEGDVPQDLWWSPGVAAFVAGLADGMARPGSLAVAVLIDYGDTTIDGIDSDEPRLRVYGPDQVHGSDAYRWPGLSDLTWDVDFGEVAALARVYGLRVAYAGPQAALEVPPIDLNAPGALTRLVPGRAREGAREPSHARFATRELVRGFRSASSGYRVMMLAGPDAAFPTTAFRRAGT